MIQERLSALYNKYYYEHYLGTKPCTRNEPWLTFFDIIASRIKDDLAPEHVLDVGCGIGLLVEALHNHDILAYGFDTSKYSISQLPETLSDYVWQGLAQNPKFYDAPDGREFYDLITCIEVTEHQLPTDADFSIGLMCQRTDVILFSSSPTDYQESTHINTRPVEYWSQQFARYGFYRYISFDASFVSQWAALYRRDSQPFHYLVRDYEHELYRLQHQVHEQRGRILELQETLSTRVTGNTIDGRVT